MIDLGSICYYNFSYLTIILAAGRTADMLYSWPEDLIELKIGS